MQKIEDGEMTVSALLMRTKGGNWVAVSHTGKINFDGTVLTPQHPLSVAWQAIKDWISSL